MATIIPPINLRLTKREIWLIDNNYPVQKRIDTKRFYGGFKLQIVDEKTNKSSLVSIGKFTVHFICEVIQRYSLTSENLKKRAYYSRTYESFAAYKASLLREFEISQRKVLKENKLSNSQIKALIYISWMLIPLWAKSESEFNRTFGALAFDYSFTYEDRYFSTNSYN